MLRPCPNPQLNCVCSYEVLKHQLCKKGRKGGKKEERNSSYDLYDDSPLGTNDQLYLFILVFVCWTRLDVDKGDNEG